MIGKVQAEISISKHKYFYGQYSVEVYLERNGQKFKLSELSFQTDVQPPSIQSIATSVDENEGKFVTRLMGVSSATHITEVSARVFCEDDDATEVQLSKDKDSWVLQDSAKNHKNHFGKYQFMFFVADKRGCKFLAGQDTASYKAEQSD